MSFDPPFDQSMFLANLPLYPSLLYSREELELPERVSGMETLRAIRRLFCETCELPLNECQGHMGRVFDFTQASYRVSRQTSHSKPETRFTIDRYHAIRKKTRSPKTQTKNFSDSDIVVSPMGSEIYQAIMARIRELE
jgi:hypothetical protein